MLQIISMNAKACSSTLSEKYLKNSFKPFKMKQCFEEQGPQD